MTSETDLVNRSLRLLKAKNISLLTDGSKNANVARDAYEGVRDELLRGHTWNFNRRLVSLARLSEAPAFGFDYAYSLPSDWLRTISLHDNDAGLGSTPFEEIEIAGVGALACSIETAYLKYGYRVTDPNRMPADFQTALVFELACQMPGISNLSVSEWEALRAERTKKVNRAKSASSLGSPPRQRPAGSWAAGRQSWPSSRWPR